MVRDAAHLHASGFALGEHLVHVFNAHLQCDMQIKIVLGLELERHVGRFKKGQATAIVHLVKRMQGFRDAATFGFANFKRVDQRQAQEVVIELAGFF